MSELIKQFFFNPRTIGAMCPSTALLGKEITTNAGIENSSVVVEVGAGTGAFTKHIIERIPPKSHFFAVEINEQVCKILKNRFPDEKIYNCCISKLPEILEEHNLQTVDSFISGLPWAVFPDKLQDDLLKIIYDNLKPGGSFVTFAYLQGMVLPSAHKFKNKLMKTFHSVEKGRVVWGNIPPAFVYRCKKEQ
jgi:phospholipid N-methyltransferase